VRSASTCCFGVLPFHYCCYRSRLVLVVTFVQRDTCGGPRTVAVCWRSRAVLVARRGFHYAYSGSFVATNLPRWFVPFAARTVTAKACVIPWYYRFADGLVVCCSLRVSRLLVYFVPVLYGLCAHWPASPSYGDSLSLVVCVFVHSPVFRCNALFLRATCGCPLFVVRTRCYVAFVALRIENALTICCLLPVSVLP